MLNVCKFRDVVPDKDPLELDFVKYESHIEEIVPYSCQFITSDSLPDFGVS